MGNNNNKSWRQPSFSFSTPDFPFSVSKITFRLIDNNTFFLLYFQSVVDIFKAVLQLIEKQDGNTQKEDDKCVILWSSITVVTKQPSTSLSTRARGMQYHIIKENPGPDVWTLKKTNFFILIFPIIVIIIIALYLGIYHCYRQY